MLKILLNVFRTLYCLNIWMVLVDTLPAVKYYLLYKVSCCTILTYLIDLKFKVTDKTFYVNIFGEIYTCLYLLNM